MNKKFVSFYQIAKEMALEEGLDFPNYTKLETEDIRKDEWTNKFRNYRKAKQDYFEDILSNQGINPDIKYKVNGKYQIPIEEKESIKLLIRVYPSKYYLKIRQGKDPKIEDIEEIIKKAENVINDNFEGEEIEKQMDSLYAATQYYSKKASKEVYDETIEMIYDSIHNVKVSKLNIDVKEAIENKKRFYKFKNPDEIMEKCENIESTDSIKIRTLSENDAEYLIQLYGKMLEATTKKWNLIANMYSELRDEEIEEEAYELLELDEESRNAYETKGKHKEPALIFKETLSIINRELLVKRKKENVNEEEMKELGEIIKSLKPNKN